MTVFLNAALTQILVSYHVQETILQFQLVSGFTIVSVISQLQVASITQRIKDDNVGFAVMLSGNCQAGPLFGVVDAGLAGIYYDTNKIEID